MRHSLTLAAVGVAATFAWGEWLNRRWSRMLVSERHGTTTSIVVLGYRNPQTTANLINRWRVRIALRSIEPTDHDVTVIFTGGTTGAGISEARLMADYAKSVLGYDGRAIIEDQSRTTWENITNALPLVEQADRIKIASQPAHAFKARAYVRRQRPDLVPRVVRGDDYRPGEWIAAKPFLAIYGLWTLRALTADERTTSTCPEERNASLRMGTTRRVSTHRIASFRFRCRRCSGRRRTSRCPQAVADC